MKSRILDEFVLLLNANKIGKTKDNEENEINFGIFETDFPIVRANADVNVVKLG